MKKLIILGAFALCVSSCCTLQYNVGKGATTGVEVQGKNHFVILGLAPVGDQKAPQELAGETKDYTVTITHSLFDCLLAAFSLGIYTPTTTIITK